MADITIETKSSDIEIDSQGRIVIKNPELKKAVEPELKKAAPGKMHILWNINCHC
jgi:hypothetical protein